MKKALREQRKLAKRYGFVFDGTTGKHVRWRHLITGVTVITTINHSCTRADRNNKALFARIDRNHGSGS